jgi:hypothetical protein
MSYTSTYSFADLELIEKHGLSVKEVEKQWSMFPDQDLVTVIGALEMLKKGQGQERNAPFAPAA